MAITVNLRYTGKNGNARKFAEEMTDGGTAMNDMGAAKRIGSSIQ